MNFSDFAGILYKYLGGDHIDSFTKELFQNIVSYSTEDENPLNEYEPAAFRAFFRGRRSIGKLSKSILKYLEPTSFAVYLDRMCDGDEIISNISGELAEYGYIVVADSFSDDVSDIFKTIIINATKRKRKSDEDDQLSAYFKSLRERYYKIKTLLYYNEPKPIYDFYVPNDIYAPRDYRKQNRLKPQQLLLSFKKKFVVITGSGGLGKTMLMHHLILTLVKQYDFYQKLPIAIQLRDFEPESSNLMQYIESRIKIKNLEEYLKAGKCVFLLDGMDEIKSCYLSQFEKNLSELADMYPENSFILSSRPITNFISLGKFEVYELAPFTKEQALALIDKLIYRPESPELKENFHKEIEESLYKSHKDFVENPLLLTIMLMTYERYAHIPYKRHVFYRDAFYTLAEKHDATKIGFDRAYKTKLIPEEFALVLEEFCTRTYFDEKFEFTDEEFEAYFNKLNVLKRLDKHFTFTDLKTDFTVNLCIMYCESGKYSFIHRSFQEYFCALHLSKAFDSGYRKIWDFFEERKNRLSVDYTFDMLYDLAPTKVERLIFVPFLTELFSKCKGDAEEQYWDFLEIIYPEINYTVGDVVASYFNLPESYIYDIILHKKGTVRKYIIDILPYDIQYNVETYLYIEKDGETECIYAGDFERENQEEYDSVEKCGHICRFKVSDVRNTKGKIHDAVLDSYFPYMLEYQEMRKCLAAMEDAMSRDSSGRYEDIF